MPGSEDLPEEFGRYRILTRLGRGGMGSVYLAQDTQLDRRVALKVPHFSEEEPSALERFRREAQLAARINHPNFCPVHDVGVFKGLDYFTMPFIEGTPLSSLTGPSRLWAPHDAAELLRKVTLAVAQLHVCGIIHRDLKPSNIILRSDGEPVLMDFGLALPFEAQTRLTSTGEPLGTPAYMPPEQARGDLKRIGPPSDVYSLGVIFYEMVTGRLPFTGQMFSLFAQILSAAPPAPSSLRPEVGIEIDRLCARAMAKDPERRFPNAGALAEALSDYLGSESSQSASNASTYVYPGAPMKSDVQITAVRHEPAPPSHDVVHVKCPRCQQTLLVLADLAGQEVPCPNCRDFHATYGGGPREGKRETPQHRTSLLVTPPPPRSRGAALWLGVALVCLLLLTPAILWLTRDRSRPDEPKERTNSIGMKLVFIPGGKFLMGSPDTEKDRSDDEGPQHEVEITPAFWLGATEVTTGQFRSFVEKTQYRTEWEVANLPDTWRKNLLETTDDDPVVFVTWNDAMMFCGWLSRKEGEDYSLPTEAEWEYACRAGSQGPFSFGERKEDQMREHAWFLSNSKARPQRVGTKKPNPWGLFDLHGNVWEWCEDGWTDYVAEHARNPRGDRLGNNRTIRGGCWNSGMSDCRSASRRLQPRGRASADVGFRVVIRVP
jgi:formylglycine-generating enzyme required for sulfatase activity/predicted Ser/Thr protein kinase